MGIGTTRQDVERLISALEDLDKKEPGHEKNWVLQLPSLSTEMAMTPRDVFLAQRMKRVPLSKAVGHISAQTLTPYPPGIPVLIPGERITQEIVDFIQDLAEKDIRGRRQRRDQIEFLIDHRDARAQGIPGRANRRRLTIDG